MNNPRDNKTSTELWFLSGDQYSFKLEWWRESPHVPASPNVLYFRDPSDRKEFVHLIESLGYKTKEIDVLRERPN